jgi:GH3 auxin-responsive promoter
METSSLTPFLKPLVDPWYESLKDPAKAQENALRNLAPFYAKTKYGRDHGTRDNITLNDFRSSIPTASYDQLRPWLEKVRNGDDSSLLGEPVERWVMTRGTTGTPKLIPTTKTHLAQILFVGARAFVNYAMRTGELDILQGKVLNLNFPSEVAQITTKNGPVAYGYSSGTYAKLNPELGTARLIPRQEEIDALGPGVSKQDWENRFELVYQTAKDTDVMTVMGVTPVITSFANYVKRRYGVLPKQFWKMKGLFCTSVAKIQTKYAPIIRHLYGYVPVVEMYTATEGVFGQQMDEHPYICPNYDMYLFEARTRKGTKMLHEMKPREWGRLIISTPIFPRYDIGDVIEAEGKNYFRITGRARKLTSIEHILYNILSGRFA